MRGRDIVCLSTNHWSGLPTSKQHLMSVLADSRRVLYVDPPLDVFSTLGRKRRWGKFRKLSRVAESIHVMSPLVIAGSSAPRRAAAFHRRAAPRVRRALDRLGFEGPILWAFAPEHAPYAGTLGEQSVVYHLADEPAGLTRDPDVVLALDRAMMDAADLILVSSESLLTERSHLGKVHRLRNAADARHFRRVISGDPDAPPARFLSDLATPRFIPAEFSRARRPIVLYAGAAYEWFDHQLFFGLAALRPQWTLVLVGPVGRAAARGPVPSNVVLIGRRSYEQLPWYVASADAAVLPLRDCPHTVRCEPIILYEYLLCGKPVVATPFPAALEKGDLVGVADSPEGFASRIESMVGAADDTDEIERRAAFGFSNTWDERAKRALELLACVSGGPQPG